MASGGGGGRALVVAADISHPVSSYRLLDSSLSQPTARSIIPTLLHMGPSSHLSRIVKSPQEARLNHDCSHLAWFVLSSASFKKIVLIRCLLNYLNDPWTV